MKSKNLKI